MVGIIVVDNSVIIPLVASDEDAKYSERVIRSADDGTRLMAPALCMYEFGNAILTCVRRERMTEADAYSAHIWLEELPIRFIGALSLVEVSAIHGLAASTGLSFYDGAYLLMAMAEQAKIATLDRALRVAAESRGIEVFE
jgi:predicted nucleic acid-binding protein